MNLTKVKREENHTVKEQKDYVRENCRDPIVKKDLLEQISICKQLSRMIPMEMLTDLCNMRSITQVHNRLYSLKYSR